MLRRPIGSPPRAWGRQWRGAGRLLRGRFTPTCVGTATPPRTGRSDRPVHPHVRGDGTSANGVPAAKAGSPPRAWGRPRTPRPRTPPTRFTPTCVGTAPGTSSSPATKSVHPHVRGDGLPAITGRARDIGSPPRAWGRHLVCGQLSYVQRFTPTCVGTAEAPPCNAPPASVHPHVRGDCAEYAAVNAAEHGSPPRAWGRRSGRLRPPEQRRFTPTCVGTARRRAPTCGGCPVHPHVRGDG